MILPCKTGYSVSKRLCLLLPALLFPASAALAVEALAPPAMYPADTWEGRNKAEIRILDRLNAHTELLTVPVGGTVTYKSVSISVKRCLSRPETLSPDTAAWVELQDNHPGSKPFSNWMLSSEPSIGIWENPLYDVKVIRCSGEAVDPALPPLPTPEKPKLHNVTAPTSNPSPYGEVPSSSQPGSPSESQSLPEVQPPS
jgi:hypothetical protein